MRGLYQRKWRAVRTLAGRRMAAAVSLKKKKDFPRSLAATWDSLELVLPLHKASGYKQDTRKQWLWRRLTIGVKVLRLYKDILSKKVGAHLPQNDMYLDKNCVKGNQRRHHKCLLCIKFQNIGVILDLGGKPYSNCD